MIEKTIKPQTNAELRLVIHALYNSWSDNTQKLLFCAAHRSQLPRVIQKSHTRFWRRYDENRPLKDPINVPVLQNLLKRRAGDYMKSKTRA